MLTMGPSRPLLLASMALSFLSPSFAASTKLVNITVDDTEGYAPENLVINYSPAGSWSPGQNCTDCEADVDPSQVNDGTWHDTTYFPDSPPSSPLSANLTFDGESCFLVLTLCVHDLMIPEASRFTCSASSPAHRRTRTGTPT